MASKPNIYELLCKRYPANEYALMSEVSDAAGHSRSRSADYIAVNLWPSRGLAIEGIELKSFRSDWLNELKNPKKAEAIFQYCDYFWLLTTDETIAKLEEIPATWGWLCIQGNRIIVKKQAPKQTPIPTSRSFMVAMLKRAASKDGFVHCSSIEDRINEAREQAKTKAEQQKDYRLKKADALLKDVAEFEEASGLEIAKYGYYGHSIKKIGAALKFLAQGGTDDVLKKIEQYKIGAEHILENLAEVISVLQENKESINAGLTGNDSDLDDTDIEDADIEDAETKMINNK